MGGAATAAAGNEGGQEDPLIVALRRWLVEDHGCRGDLLRCEARGDDGGGDGRRLTPTRPKWYAILGDDLHLQAANLAGLLSAFDPDEDWAITQAGVSAKHGFRSFGGAGIVTSRALTARLAP